MFGKRFGFYTLTVVSQSPYFYHLYLVVPTEEMKKKLIAILSSHLLYQETPQKTITDKMLDWVSVLIPDEEEISKETDLQVVSERLRRASL